MRPQLDRILTLLGLRTPAGGSENDARRDRSIRLAILTSLLSKGGTALLQLVSIPIAIRVLTFETFGIYSTVALAVYFVAIFQLGVGPGLTHGISQALARGDRRSEQEYYSTSFLLALAMALIGGFVATVVFATVPVPRLFGDEYAAHASQMKSALWVGTAIIVAQFALNHTERARDGYLESKINNAWGAAGNLLGALSVGIGIFFFPTIEFLLISVYGSNVVGKIGNTIHLLVSRPHLLPSLRHFRRPLARKLFKDGFANTTAGALTPLVQFNVCGIIIAHLAGPRSVGIYNILIQIDTILAGSIVMFTMSTWPAVADAFARHDLSWIRSTIRRLRAMSLGYAGLAGAGLVILGPILIPIWAGEEVGISRTILASFSLLFLAGMYHHVNHALLMGAGKITTVAVCCAFESAAALVLAIIGIHIFGLAGLLLGIFLSKAFVSGVVFPRVLDASLRAHESEAPAAPPPGEAAPAL